MSPRLDQELTARSLARSRNHAARLIAAGSVRVDGAPVTKAALKVTAETEITVTGDDGYVSRGAHKLVHALDTFQLTAAGALALDLGASTGGFTQVLLQRGAKRVLAVDVGHDQLADVLARDERVTSAEGINVRYLTPEALADIVGSRDRPNLITGDLSFISLTQVLGAIAEVAASDADVVLLIKPQFEVGRHGIQGGIVTDQALVREAVQTVLAAAESVGLLPRGLTASPLTGTHGNREFLVWLRREEIADHGAHRTEWMSTIDEVVRRND